GPLLEGSRPDPTGWNRPQERGCKERDMGIDRTSEEDFGMSQEEEMRSLKLVLVQSTTGGNR
ncbi:MAG: hypothetical protein WC119_11505, partial [Synergistaceae bacterium]